MGTSTMRRGSPTAPRSGKSSGMKIRGTKTTAQGTVVNSSDNQYHTVSGGKKSRSGRSSAKNSGPYGNS